MPIKPFSFPLPETRFFHTSKYVYKFKIRYGVHVCSENTENKEQVSKELLDSIRAILANSENLQPFSTKNFIIFPYKSKWDSASRLRFKHGQKLLQPFPYVFTIYVEPYTLVSDSCVDSTSEQESQIGEDPAEVTQDEEIQDKEAYMNKDNKGYLVSGDSDKLCGTLCPAMDHDTQSTGGFVEFLLSLTPLKYLFRRGQTE
ncbi:membrane-anchored junction protein isoform X2 [Dendropsophus ebraccatus]